MAPLTKRLVSMTTLGSLGSLPIPLLADRLDHLGHVLKDLFRVLASVLLLHLLEGLPGSFEPLSKHRILVWANDHSKGFALALHNHWFLGVIHQTKQLGEVGSGIFC